MIDYRKRYKELKTILLTLIVIIILLILFFGLNIKIRNEKIRQLELEKDNLEEIIQIEKIKEEK